MKKRKRSPRKTLRNKLDKICRELARERDNCQRCGGTHFLQTAHIFSRKNLAVRWDLDNLLLLCAKCHFWAHQNPVLFTEFVYKHLGNLGYLTLKVKATSIKKWTDEELREYLKTLKDTAEHKEDLWA